MQILNETEMKRIKFVGTNTYKEMDLDLFFTELLSNCDKTVSSCALSSLQEKEK